jgi:hypothetical protein
MTIDTLGMIRRGWQEVAATVAPRVPGLSDLLEKRLGEAIRLGSLDESSLLAIVDAATQLAANAGAVDVAPTLSKRLRRHVYEYLLSLDAAAADDEVRPAPPTLAQPDGTGPLIGADEVAALGRELPPGTTAAGLDPVAFAEPWPQAGAAAPPSAGEPAPRFSFHIGDPDDLLSPAPRPGERIADGSGVSAGDVFAPADLPPGGHDPLSMPRRASFADPSSWPKPLTPQLRGGRPASADAPLAGGQDDGSAAPGASEPLAPQPRFQELSWPPRTAETAPAGNGRSPTAEADGRVATDPEPAGTSEAGAPVAEATETPGRLSHQDPAAPVTPPDPGSAEAPAGSPGASEDPGSEPAPQPRAGPGWAPRQPETVELHLVPPSDPGTRWAGVADPISEQDLAQLRSSVEEKLRKKRCDDAAAILQQAAQELGGQAVAELALDAGDRCRTLGKRNAALNCYLAASRADPVYEAPLARLADICIDDQDIDLAVSYLERIARLTRLRGDQRGALRIYRKIATIAPYRDDVLEMLMRAQTTGRIDA